MKTTLLATAVLAAVLAVGCGEKEAETSDLPMAEIVPSEPAPGEAAPAATPAEPAPGVPAADYATTFAQAEQQVQKRDYEGATRTLIQVQYLTPQADEKAATANFNKMRQMQINLAEELSRNPRNANAQKAAEMLQMLNSRQQAPQR